MSGSPQLTPMPDYYIAPHILRSEFECSCCHQLPFDFDKEHPSEPFKELFAAFAAIRTARGRAITITSGYRCIAHNRAVGGEERSTHLVGLALDLGVSGPHELMDLKNIIVSTWPSLRVGWKTYLNTGRNLVHIDVGYLWIPRFSPSLVQGARW